MGKILAGGIILGASAPSIQLHPLQTLLEVLAACAGLGGLVVGLVAIYGAKSGRNLNNMQAMEILFERQREVNLDLLTQRDMEIARLTERLEDANGERARLEERLGECRRDRQLIRNQLKGLEDTIKQLRDTRKREKD